MRKEIFSAFKKNKKTKKEILIVAISNFASEQWNLKPLTVFVKIL